MNMVQLQIARSVNSAWFSAEFWSLYGTIEVSNLILSRGAYQCHSGLTVHSRSLFSTNLHFFLIESWRCFRIPGPRLFLITSSRKSMSRCSLLFIARKQTRDPTHLSTSLSEPWFWKISPARRMTKCWNPLNSITGINTLFILPVFLSSLWVTELSAGSGNAAQHMSSYGWRPYS